MTTPASNTPYGVINDAMRDAGLLQLGDTPTPEHLAENLRRLRDLINLWQIQGLKLWTLADTAVPLTAGTNQYTFFPGGSVDMTKPLRVLQGYYLFTATNVRRSITPISWQEYLTLGQSGTLAANRGPISQYFVEKLADRIRVTFWLCPDTTEAANGQAHVLLQTQITNPTELDETLQFPEEWRMALRWGLADDICTGQPEAIMARCAQRATTYRTALEDWDVEDTTISFQPDQRAGHMTGRFR